MLSGIEKRGEALGVQAEITKTGVRSKKKMKWQWRRPVHSFKVVKGDSFCQNAPSQKAANERKNQMS